MGRVTAVHYCVIDDVAASALCRDGQSPQQLMWGLGEGLATGRSLATHTTSWLP